MLSPLFDLHEALVSLGKDRAEDMKLYRHSSNVNSDDPFAMDIERVIHSGDLEIFQSVQRNRQLGNGLVAFFMGETGRLSRFLGIWKVLTSHDWQHQSPRASLARSRHYLRSDNVWHELEHDKRFDSLANRVVIEWPETGRHHQWLVENGVEKRKIKIREIRPEGFIRPFPGFEEVVLGFSELQRLIRADIGGWSEAMSSTKGVYLISDLASGELYVGSATGSGGLWGRWQNYSRDGHGGNKLLMERIASGDLKAENMQFSILQTMGNLASAQAGLDAEVRWKKKLGRRAVALNGN